MKKSALVSFLFALIFSFGVSAKTFGPYEAEYIKNYDADSITIRFEIWPDVWMQRNVRLYGLDTPEKSWRAACIEEKEMADKASAHVTQRLKEGGLEVMVLDTGKFGRLLVKISINGEDLGAELISLGYAREYFGAARESWCLN